MLAYTTGWKVFFEMLQMGLFLGSALVISSIAGIFAEERQTKMMQLIFTTLEGRKKDLTAKVAASLLVTFCIFAGVVFVDLILCGSIYGLDGFTNIAGVVQSGWIPSAAYKAPFWEYLGVILLLGLEALLLLCAITMCVSWHQNNYVDIYDYAKSNQRYLHDLVFGISDKFLCDDSLLWCYNHKK